MNKPEPTVTLSISVTNRKVEAHLVFTNTTSAAIYLNKYRAGLDNIIEANVFIISTNSMPVPFALPVVKREANESDFVEVKPHTKATTTISLDKAYKFPTGSHIFDTYYQAYHRSQLTGGLLELKSNTVTFTLK